MKESFLKKYGALIAASVIFFTLGLIYCAPSLQGKVLQSSDDVNAVSAVQESLRYSRETGDCTFWNGAMFGGMPNYQIGGGTYKAERLIRPFTKFFKRGTSHPAWIIIFYLFSFYFLLRAFDIGKWLSIAGAAAIAFSSYFIVIIAAGHGGKTIAISYISLVIAGFYLIFRKKYGLGLALTMFFTCIGFTVHTQMSYYLFMMTGTFWLAELWIHIKEKRYRDFILATVLFAGGVAIGLGTRSANVLGTEEYAKETIRGGHSDLTPQGQNTQSQSGLSLDYATQYSYGLGESFSFIIPGVRGGASAVNLMKGKKSGNEPQLYRTLVKNGIDRKSAAQVCQRIPMYWGDQPFTAGNVYMGAVVCFLFVLGLMLVKGPYKWAIAASTLLSVMLAWGFHFMPLTRLFFNWFPLYNKFRAVSSILVVAEIAMPLLGFMAVKQLFDSRENSNTQNNACIFRSIYIATGITAGICLFMALFAGAMFDFKSAADASFSSGLPDFFYQGILDERKALLVSDSWRSFLFIILTAALLWLFQKGYLKKGWTIAVLCVLVIADLWKIDQRYFNSDNFISPKQSGNTFAMRDYEKRILADKEPGFRVFNLTASPFIDARTSYYLRSVGGYHAAKLRRYQDLIDEHLSQMSMPVLNMLNTKYFITKGDDGNAEPVLNPNAMGAAWFVQSVQVADNAKQEIDALSTIDLRNIAVTDNSFSEFAAGSHAAGSDAEVRLLSYTPKSLDYEYEAGADGTIVFSEIYYPYGWKATIDGQPADHFRVNYVLRAMNVPAGRHRINFVFEPDCVAKGNILSMICILLMYGLMALSAVMAVLKFYSEQ